MASSSKKAAADLREAAAVQGALVAAAKDAQKRNAGQGFDQELQDDVRRKVDYQNSLTPAGAGRGTAYKRGGRVTGYRGYGKAKKV